MKRDYSRILLHENNIANVDPHPMASAIDVGIVLFFSVMERGAQE